jgi:hypothetical protein
MSHLKQRILAIVLGVLVAVPVAAALAAGGARHAPTLTLSSRSPVTVVGRHFTPRTLVRVTLAMAGTRSRKVQANAQGAFTTTFSTTIDRCSSWSVTASQPGRAPVVIRSGAKPLCAPAGTP